MSIDANFRVNFVEDLLKILHLTGGWCILIKFPLPFSFTTVNFINGIYLSISGSEWTVKLYNIHSLITLHVKIHS